MKLIKMCLMETYNEVRISKHLSDAYAIQIGRKGEMIYHYFFAKFL